MVLDILIRAFFALMFVGSGVYHLVNPDFFMPLMPSFLPAHRQLIIWSGVVEILVGVGLFVPAVQTWAIWGVIALLVVFTPIHIIDLGKEKPAVGSKSIAIGRLVMQFVLIAAAFYLLV